MIYTKEDFVMSYMSKTIYNSIMASLFRSLYGMPGLAPRMDVLS